MGLWPYYSNALLYGDYANEANLHTRTKVHGIVTVKDTHWSYGYLLVSRIYLVWPVWSLQNHGLNNQNTHS